MYTYKFGSDLEISENICSKTLKLWRKFDCMSKNTDFFRLRRAKSDILGQNKIILGSRAKKYTYIENQKNHTGWGIGWGAVQKKLKIQIW